jgi:hypothetical protein
LALSPGVLFPTTPLIAVAVRPRSRAGSVVVTPIRIALRIGPPRFVSAALIFESPLLPLSSLLFALPVVHTALIFVLTALALELPLLLGIAALFILLTLLPLALAILVVLTT